MNLKQEMSLLEEPRTGRRPPHWEYWRWELWHLAQSNPSDNFLRWPCVYHTMLQDHWPQVVAWEMKEMLAISGSLPANVTPLPWMEPRLSQERNNVRQMYHLWKWEQVTGKRIHSLKRIVEVGGGYGAMAMMARRMGFQGEYIIYDLPEFSLLQRWYLGQAGVMANFATEPIGTTPTDLLIGIYSLAEMPMDTRAEIFASYPASSQLHLYSGQWEKYDNVSYFQGAEGWYHEELTHLPDRGNWYSIQP